MGRHSIHLLLFIGCIIHLCYGSSSFSSRNPNGKDNIPCPTNLGAHSCVTRSSDGAQICPGFGHNAADNKPACNGSPNNNRDQFAKDFATAGHVYTAALCRTDSDVDGKTNGDELGDPCCEWTTGATPRRLVGITIPGFKEHTTTFPSCLLAGPPAIPLAPTAPTVRPTYVMLDWTTALAETQTCWCKWMLFKTNSAGLNPINLGLFSWNKYSYTDTAVTFSMTYGYFLMAYNLAGNSTAGPILYVTTPSPSVPDVVTQVKITGATNSSIALAWSAPQDNGAPITAYEVYCVNGTYPTDVVVVTSPAANFSRPFFAPGQSYGFVIRANNTIGGSPWSAVFVFPTNQANAAPPATPLAPRIISGDNSSLTLSWNSSNPNGGLILFYEIQMKIGNAAYNTVAIIDALAPGFSLSSLFTTISNLRAGTSYQFRLRVQTTVGQSSFSPSVTGSPIRCNPACIRGTCVYNYPSATCLCTRGYTGRDCANATISPQFNEGDYPFVTTLSEEGNFTLWWRIIDAPEPIIEFALQGTYKGYLSVGLSPSTAMNRQKTGCQLEPTPTSDVYITGIDDQGLPYAYDYYNHDFIALCLDDDSANNGSNSIIGFNGNELNGVTTIKFQRLLKTGDPHDIDIELNKAMTLIWAASDADVLDPAGPPQHRAIASARGYLQVDFASGALDGTVELRQGHGILMTAFIVLFGLSALRKYWSSWVLNKTANFIHLGLVVLGLVCLLPAIGLGVWAVRLPFVHMGTLHAWFGWATVVAALVHPFIAAVNDRQLAQQKRLRENAEVSTWTSRRTHSVLEFAALLFGTSSVLSGLLDTQKSTVINDATLIHVFLLVIGVFVGLSQLFKALEVRGTK